MVMKERQGGFFAPAHEKERRKIMGLENACSELTKILVKYDKAIKEKEESLSTHNKASKQARVLQCRIEEMIANQNHAQERLVALEACLLELKQQQPDKVRLPPPNGAMSR